MQTHFIDAHLHLQDPRFGKAVDTVVARARNAGVTQLFCNAVSETDWQLVGELAAAHQEIIPFLGIHPWFSDSVRPGWQDRLIDMAGIFVRFAGIGEAGLDRSCQVDFSLQKALFSDQLELAARHGWPLTVHCVRAWGPLIDILNLFSKEQTLPPIMIHSFNGSTETMKRLIGLGCYISFSEALLNQQQKSLHDTFRQTPQVRILLETDAPYDKNPGRRNKDDGSFNEPADVVELYGVAAHLLNMSSEDLGSRIFNNAAVFTNKNAPR